MVVLGIIGVIVIAYLLGSVSFAVVTSHAFGLADPRSYGSGNPGATNVLRSGNKLAAILTLIGDAAKGWFAVWLAQHLDVPDVGPVMVAAAGLAVALGHVFPVFLKFKGGKGVATALGVLLALSVWLALATVAIWLLVAATTRYSSLAAIIAAVAAPIAGWFLLDQAALRVCVVCIAVLLIWRHQGNITKLLSGVEGRIGDKKKPENRQADVPEAGPRPN
jgi:glycerol-3-phosphate acyltransferase PlsY